MCVAWVLQDECLNQGLDLGPKQLGVELKAGTESLKGLGKWNGMKWPWTGYEGQNLAGTSTIVRRKLNWLAVFGKREWDFLQVKDDTSGDEPVVWKPGAPQAFVRVSRGLPMRFHLCSSEVSGGNANYVWVPCVSVDWGVLQARVMSRTVLVGICSPNGGFWGLRTCGDLGVASGVCGVDGSVFSCSIASNLQTNKFKVTSNWLAACPEMMHTIRVKSQLRNDQTKHCSRQEFTASNSKFARENVV